MKIGDKASRNTDCKFPGSSPKQDFNTAGLLQLNINFSHISLYDFRKMPPSSSSSPTLAAIGFAKPCLSAGLQEQGTRNRSWSDARSGHYCHACTVIITMGSLVLVPVYIYIYNAYNDTGF